MCLLCMYVRAVVVATASSKLSHYDLSVSVLSVCPIRYTLPVSSHIMISACLAPCICSVRVSESVYPAGQLSYYDLSVFGPRLSVHGLSVHGLVVCPRWLLEYFAGQLSHYDLSASGPVCVLSVGPSGVCRCSNPFISHIMILVCLARCVCRIEASVPL